MTRRHNEDLPTGFHGRPSGPSARVFPPRNDRVDEIPGLKPEMPFLPRQMADGEAVLVGAAHLPMAATLGCPDLHVSGHRREMIRRAFADAQRIVVMSFGQVVRNPLLFGTTARPAFDGQPRRLELRVEPPAGRIHHRSILQRRFQLLLDAFQADGFPRRRGGIAGRAAATAGVLGKKVFQPSIVFALIAVRAGQREIGDPIRTPAALGNDVIELKVRLGYIAVGAATVPFVQHVLANFVA